MSVTLARRRHVHSYHVNQTKLFNEAVGNYQGRDASKIFGISRHRVCYLRKKVYTLHSFAVFASSLLWL
jgi:hypothetical protein